MQFRVLSKDNRLKLQVLFIFYFLIKFIFREVGLFGLPPDFNFEEHERHIDGERIIEDFYEAGINRNTSFDKVALKFIKDLKPDQYKVFETIADGITGKRNKDKNLFFVEGSGGCGKPSFITH